MIYFVQCKQFVKIGCTDNFSRRYKELQSANPFTLKLLHTMEGSYDTEAALHTIFKAQRSRGEWFNYKHYLKDCLMGVKDEHTPYEGKNLKDLQRAGLHLRARKASKRKFDLKKRLGSLETIVR